MFTRPIFQGAQLALVASSLFLLQPSFAAEETITVPTEDVRRFADTLTLIKNYYVSPMKNHELFNKAIGGILTGLDPQSAVVYNATVETEPGIQAVLASLGLELTVKDDIISVITPKIGSSAFKAGIMPGDYLIKLGSKALQGMSLDEVQPLLQGKEGKTITAVVLRKGVAKPIVVHLVFEKNADVSVNSRLLEKQIGYIQISEFQKKTPLDLAAAIKDLKQQAGGSLKGMILDLRFNPGGELESAVNVADAFIDNQKKNPHMLIVQTEGRVSDLQLKAQASPGDILEKAPMVVLINKGSAYGAEIVAGALKDNQRAITLGQPSAGKGSIQTLIPLDKLSSLKLTTAFYLTPKGALIQGKGITPDMLVEALSIPKVREGQESARVSEADLKDHIVAGGAALKAPVKADGQNAQDLIHEDYQLFTAVSILKGTMLTSGRDKIQ